MKSLTIKEIFKAINDYNNAREVCGYRDEKIISIYIDEMRLYKGNNYRAFKRVLKEEYVKNFCDQLDIALFCGYENITIFCNGNSHKIEVYIVEE